MQHTVNMDSSKVYSVPALYGDKIKPSYERFGLWLLKENLSNDNLLTDIGNIDFTAGEELLVHDDTNPIPITEPFCDNLMLVKICGVEDCEEIDKRRFLKKIDVFNAFNPNFSRKIREKFSKMVSAEHVGLVEAKQKYLLNSGSDMSKNILQVLGKDNQRKVQQKYKKPVGVTYKVELSDVPIATMMKELPNLLEQLKKDHFYLLNLNITQEFAGILNKSILTWDNNNVKVKIYNKFICQLTSPGVKNNLGNHVIDFIVCQDTRLRKTFTSNSARIHGTTCMEATIFNYSLENRSTSKTFDPIQDSLLLLNDIENYFRKAPLFSVSLSKMWTKLADTVKNSCCLVYNNLLQYVYWGNSNTKTLTGVQVKLPTNPEQRNEIISYVISAFSFNSLPINYVEIMEDTENRDNISFTQKCYIKSGETYFSKSTTLFSKIAMEVNLDELGLVKTSNIIPQVLRKRTNKSKLALYTVSEIEPPSPIRVLTRKLAPYPGREREPLSPITVGLPSARKRKLELDEIDLKRRKMEFEQSTESIKKQHQQQIGCEYEMKTLTGQLEQMILE